MRFITLVLTGAALCSSACSAEPQERDADAAVSVADVHAFVAAWRNLAPPDTGCAALTPYWESASPGLRAYRRKFDVTFASLCAAVRASPERYSQLAARLDEIDSATAVVRTVYERFDSIRPMRHRPAVYLLVGNGIAGGTIATVGRRPSVLIGMELNTSVTGLTWMIAHELVHTQQDYPLFGTMTGGPRFLRGTVLRHSIKEGSANFIAEVLTGQPVRNAYAEAHEAALWSDFQRDANGKDYGLWLYNGWNRKAVGDRPPDLGYWMGYRITKAYYERSADKARALDEILTIRDFPAFLESSRYAGTAQRSEAPNR